MHTSCCNDGVTPISLGENYVCEDVTSRLPEKIIVFRHSLTHAGGAWCYKLEQEDGELKDPVYPKDVGVDINQVTRPTRAEALSLLPLVPKVTVRATFSLVFLPLVPKVTVRATFSLVFLPRD